MKMNRVLPAIQGSFFFITGVWPLLHLESFLAVTGPKTDIWLLNTVSLLILSSSLVLLQGAVWKNLNTSVYLTGFLSALSLGFIDVYYSLHEVIWPIYLADAFIEFFFVAGNVYFLISRKQLISKP